MTLDDITPGRSGTTSIVVGTRDTAPRIGSGKIKILATPVLITLLEEAALEAVEHLLPAGFQTVGTRLEVSHTAATPVGLRVDAHAEVEEVSGRRIRFRVWAEDEFERIGEGMHERIVVNVERFDRRIGDKAVPTRSSGRDPG